VIARNAQAPELHRTAPGPLEGLTDALRTGASLHDPDDRRVPYALATLSSYAYADELTMTSMAARLGLVGNHCRMVSQFVDALFISSTAFLLQSADGRVVILVYRGTPPESLIAWLADLQIDPEQITIHFRGRALTSSVHRGFYRNVRATGLEVVAGLHRALQGQTVTVDASGHSQRTRHPMEALYITGHSLGAAMAALAALLMRSDVANDSILSTLKGVVTFGQPMVGDPDLARLARQDELLARTIVRYVYGHDVVAQLPPKASGEFEHFGREVRHTGPEVGGSWSPSPDTEQMRNLLARLLLLGPSFLAPQLKVLRRLRFTASLYDHLPQHYMGALAPDGLRSEFGD
jgi:hypothetical protein